jgi:hypothetical protein
VSRQEVQWTQEGQEVSRKMKKYWARVAIILMAWLAVDTCPQNVNHLRDRVPSESSKKLKRGYTGPFSFWG